MDGRSVQLKFPDAYHLYIVPGHPEQHSGLAFLLSIDVDATSSDIAKRHMGIKGMARFLAGRHIRCCISFIANISCG